MTRQINQDIQAMEYYLAQKKEVSIKPWKDMEELKCILLSEGSQAEKATCCMIPNIGHSGEGKTMEKIKV